MQSRPDLCAGEWTQVRLSAHCKRRHAAVACFRRRPNPNPNPNPNRSPALRRVGSDDSVHATDAACLCVHSIEVEPVPDDASCRPEAAVT